MGDLYGCYVSNKLRMSIIVYWIINKRIEAAELASSELLEALTLVERLRKEGARHVTISTELEESIGKPGVNDVLPDGYDWKKRRN